VDYLKELSAMLIFQSLRKPARHLGAILFSLAVSTPAFAAKDELQVSNVNSVSVAGQAAASSSTTGGGHRQLTLSSPVVGAKSVSVQVTWGIVAGNDPRSTTWPNNGVTFSAETTRGAPISPITTGPVSCDFETASSTCSFTISFTTPNQTEPNYQIRVRPTVPSKTPGNRELQPRDLSVNFSVIQAVAKLDTTMTVPDPQCFVYGQGEVNLAATLSERVSTNPIAGRLIQFALGNSASGSAITGTDGQALWPFDISTLGAGDFNLYAEFEGDDAYNPSNDSGTFGVSYRFIGFQQPINADGTSVFGNGRIIPVKIKLADANLQPVTTAAPTVWMTQVSPLTALGSDYEPATSVSAADTGNTMRYVPEDDHYIFNWDLSTLSNGTWYVVVDLGDSDACSQGTHYATITVNKKKGK
jgi:hypothetical protein